MILVVAYINKQGSIPFRNLLCKRSDLKSHGLDDTPLNNQAQKRSSFKLSAE